MKISEFLSFLYQRGVIVQVDQGNININAPRGTLSPEIQDQLRERKEEIIAFLAGEQAVGYEYTPIRRVDRSQPIPASSSQRGLWFQYQLEGTSNTYNVPLLYHLIGVLNIPALEKSLQYLIARHESLRMSFKAVDSEPYLVIAENTDWELDVRCSNGKNFKRELVEVAARPFSLEQAPLFRAHVWTDFGNEHTLLLNFHHIVLDEWAKGIFEHELSTVYARVVAGEEFALPALKLDYVDYAAWQRKWLESAEFKQGLTFWKENLTGAPELLELPCDLPRPVVQLYIGDRVKLDLDEGLVVRLQELARREQVTLFMVMNLAYALLLGRYSRKKDVIIGIPMANRLHKELEGVVGFFVNTLPLRIDLGGNPTLPEMLRRVRKIALNAYDHQNVPFDRLIDELHIQRDTRYSPVFQTLFTMTNMFKQELHLGECVILSDHVSIGVAKFDLSLFVEMQINGLGLELEFNTWIFEPATAERMLAYYKRILDWMVSAPSNGIQDFELLSSAEKQQILVDWNGPAVKFDSETCIHQLIEAQTKNNPDAPAIAFEHQVMTYRELDQRANQLAHYLRAQGVSPDVLVGIFMERSPDLIVALLGILKAGGAYVPLDRNCPGERLKFICQESNPKLILSQQSIRSFLHEIENVPILSLDVDWETLVSPYSTLKPENLSRPFHLANVLFTSGTTGRPKGVALPHRSVRGLVEWIKQNFSTQELCGVLASTSISFDMSGFEIFGSLAWGGCLILVENILQVMVYDGKQPVTLINTVPSAIAELLYVNGIPPSVKTIVLAGEVLLPQLVDELYQVPGIQRIFDSYGPTETSYSTLCLRRSGAHPTIGKPLPGWKIYILDANNHPLPVGIPGEIYIGGIGIACGYYGRPDLTEENFLLNPFEAGAGERFYRTGDLARWLSDGSIEYLGRMDHQVKIRGFRVELDEIEYALSDYPFVHQAVVVMREDTHRNKHLVGYIIPSSDTTLDVKKLRNFLRERLPEYMIPSAFVQMESFPVTINGKIDRKALPAPEMSPSGDQAYIAPRSQTEQTLSKIWMDVLGLTRISLDDYFFDVGGTSLSAIRVMTRIQDEFEIAVTVRRIFEFPRLSELARYVEFGMLSQKHSLGSEEATSEQDEFVL